MPTDMKLMIAATFAKMTRKKPVDKITVKDLVECCGISRQTFYYYFQDLLEVMEWSIQQLLQKALNNSLEANTPEESIQEFLRVSTEYGEVLLRLLASQRREQVERVFVDAIQSAIRQLILDGCPELAWNHQQMEVALRFYACGMTGVIFDACRNPSADYEQLSHQLYQLYTGTIHTRP